MSFILFGKHNVFYKSKTQLCFFESENLFIIKMSECNQYVPLPVNCYPNRSATDTAYLIKLVKTTSALSPSDFLSQREYAACTFYILLITASINQYASIRAFKMIMASITEVMNSPKLFESGILVKWEYVKLCADMLASLGYKIFCINPEQIEANVLVRWS